MLQIVKLDMNSWLNTFSLFRVPIDPGPPRSIQYKTDGRLGGNDAAFDGLIRRLFRQFSLCENAFP
jgi:hypothetical protein